MRVLEVLADGAQDAELRDALELAHARPLARRRADHGRRRVELLQVLHDGERLAETAPVVELEDGEPAHRVLLEELRLAVVPGHDVDRLEGDAEPLLGEIDTELLRVRCADEIVDLHGLVLPWFGRDGSSRWRIADRPPHASGGVRPPTTSRRAPRDNRGARAPRRGRARACRGARTPRACARSAPSTSRASCCRARRGGGQPPRAPGATAPPARAGP